MTTGRKINFGAGPAKLPEEVLLKAQSELLNFQNTGVSILEMSHRSKDFGEVIEETKNLFRTIMSIPEEFEILFLQGGGTGQFAAIPLNLKGEHTFAEYAITGAWSSKASQEAEKYIEVRKVFPVKKPYTTIPDVSEWQHDEKAAYLYYCDNETVQGIEYPCAPKTPHGVPLVADISSSFLSRPFDFTNHGIVYGGVQKNLGPAGVTVVFVHKDLIGKEHPMTPSVFSYKEMADNNSLLNTPAVYGIYLTNLVLKWIKNAGGVNEIHNINKAKSSMIYSLIDNSNGFYSCAIDPVYRSEMNICFRVGENGGNENIEAEFIKGAQQKGMIGLKGHRSVGGIRASLYNAVTMEETETLAEFMKEFQKNHQKQ